MINGYNDLIDRMDGYDVGTLIIEGDRVSLMNVDDTIKPVTNAHTIDVLNGREYVTITPHDAIHTLTREGWPLYAGLYARIRK